ncbi:HIT finger domain protein [Aspergillus bombycis]|uniref:Box C/D snoRNA protein 1 n=1 Tax=Aspergillus bombycis TaxID=109264 RepID=A0A1F8AAJ6_9EURO|nr:HIT finger domain protein [Aspergillus bombycis]OGM48746.1 HIT finger domain protein [Aspergillus bombycis]
MSSETPLLSDLCTICHIQPPKYRCPRCSTRTCSLPCSRRHKLWSQCSGVRDPAAYIKKNELATESAFDRDFNFITGIERTMERAERDAENRGISVQPGTSGRGVDLAAVGLDGDEESGTAETGRKRRRVEGGSGGFVRGEFGFLRGAEDAGVTVLRAPRGMSRNKANSSKWMPKYVFLNKCLNWSVEWVAPDGERRIRLCLESLTLAEAYDRSFPLSKEEREQKKKDQESKAEQVGVNSSERLPDTRDPTPSTAEATPQEAPQEAVLPNPESETKPDITPQDQPMQSTDEITSHRELYVYLHRPRTSTKQPVLVPLSPTATLTSALRGRTVLEFPTIYILSNSPDALSEEENSKFLLEKDYLRMQPQGEAESGETSETDGDQPAPGSVDISNLDEKKVLEVLQKDLLEPV